ncbi:hypothetical protein [Chitinophaga sp.]|uniref:hypothetical protein n=1 Tax=Chitinophaga sp. TaxID=1869181 RepID=UPI0031D19E3F
MEYNEIRALLTRYWEGETSLEEEELLRGFFAEHQQGLPADLQEAAPLFGYFAVEAAREVGEMTADYADKSAVVVAIPRPYQHWMKYAAVLLLGVGLVYGGRQYKIKQEEGGRNDAMAQALNQADTYDDPKEAYVATKKALELLAKNLNKGTAQAKKIAYFNEATEYIKAD